jgi:CheY-like chemotaxis protein
MYKILIVDDEPDVLETVSEIIEEKFSTGVDKATNGLDAFLLCQTKLYDLIVTDHKMPFMTGAAFVIATRTKPNQNQNTPFIMLSAFIDDETRKNLGIQKVYFIEKPFKPEDLFSKMRDIL